MPADHGDLDSVKTYVPLKTIDPEVFERQLLCKECEEVVFFEDEQEVWNTKEIGRSGKMMLPANVSATIYRGKYLVL